MKLKIHMMGNEIGKDTIIAHNFFKFNIQITFFDFEVFIVFYYKTLNINLSLMNIKNIIKFSRKSLFSQSKYAFTSTTLAANLEIQVSTNQYRNAFRFENQNKIWDFKEINVINLTSSSLFIHKESF